MQPSKVNNIYTKCHRISYVPTQLPHLSFRLMQKPKKSHSICSYEIETENLQKREKIYKHRKSQDTIQNLEEYVREKLINSSMDSIHYINTLSDSKVFSLEKSHSINSSISKKTHKTNKVVLPYLNIKTKDKIICEENFSKSKEDVEDIMKLPSFITDRTLESEKLKNKEIMKIKKIINSCVLSIKKIDDKKNKLKSKKPYVKTQEDLVKDAHYVVFELDNGKNYQKNKANCGPPGNTLKSFSSKHKTLKKEFEENDRKEVRFPLLFKKVLENFKEIKRPDNNFQLFSQTPYNKLVMRNVNQTLRIYKTKS